MNLFFVTFHYGDIQNGPGRFADYFVRYITTQCRSITLTVVSADSGESKYGEKVVSINRSHHKGATILSALQIFRYLRNRIKKGEVDSIYYNSPNNAIFLPRNVDLYMNFNDYYNAAFKISDFFHFKPYEAFYKFLWRMIEKRHCSRLSRIFVNSQYTKNSIMKSYNTNSDKITVTYKAVDILKFEGIIKKRIDHVIELIFIGTDYRRKGLTNALKVVRTLIKDYKVKCQFNIIGNYKKKELEDIETSIHNHGLSEHSTIFSSNIDVTHHLAQSDFLLLPAKDEALGVVILEALASGVLVIASDAGGIPEIVSHGKDGFLFKNTDIGGMARKIYDLSNDQKTYENVVHNGITKSKMFSVDRIFENIVSVLLH